MTIVKTVELTLIGCINRLDIIEDTTLQYSGRNLKGLLSSLDSWVIKRKSALNQIEICKIRWYYYTVHFPNSP